MPYPKPNKLYRAINHWVGRLASVGFTPADTVAVETVGRRSGKPRSTAVTWAEHGGQRYLISLAGESDWVRNANAAGGRAVIRRGRSQERVHLLAVAVEERAPVLKAYMSKRAFSRSPSYIARNYFGVSPNASLEDLAAIAPSYPVFRIEKASD